MVGAHGRHRDRTGSPPPAIELRGVVKRFGELTAVAGLDLTVPSGICLGLLGPNGAGKSTTMKMLTAQTLATEGTITVLGFELPRESKQSRMAMGVVPQQDNLDVELTCRQILGVFAQLYRVPRGERAEAIERALGIANLTRSGRHGRARALGRDAAQAARRAGARPPAAAAAARRADRRPRSPGPPGAVVTDRLAALGRRDRADVDPLHRGGRAAGRHRLR